MGERTLLRSFRAKAPRHPWLKVGPGQDCAILSWPAGRDMAFKIDQIVEGTHFVLSGPEAASPVQVGWKAMAKACSDIAASGFWPVAAAVAVHLRRGLDDPFALELYRGLCACCQRFSFALAGGDLTSGAGAGAGILSVCVSLLGEGPSGASGAWLRSGARTGDALLVTGTLGGSRGGKHLDFQPRLAEAKRIRELLPKGVHACLDITDGLARDLLHLCEESRCGVELEQAALPVSVEAREAAKISGRGVLERVLGDGEDFELLLAVDPEGAARLRAAWDHATPLHEIGRIVPPGQGRRLKHTDGHWTDLPDLGYEHQTENKRGK